MIIRLHQGGGQRARHNVRVYATAALPRLTMKWRVPYCNNGKRGERKQEREGGREEKYTALQQGSKIPQSVLAEQIETITARGIFSFGILFPPLHLICHEVPECSDQTESE